MCQLSLFPELKPKDKNILFVIGNGFDIAHGIESRYSDFEKWVSQKGNSRLIQLMDSFFSNSISFWKDVENALGDYNEEDIAEYCNPNDKIDYDHPTQYTASYEDSPDWIFKPILDEFLELFTQWVNNIDIRNIELFKNLPVDSKYLTFNYTETLEKYYGVPTGNVCHIHGSRLAKSDYIIGHNKFYRLEDIYQDNSELLYKQDTWCKIIRWMNELYKDTAKIISLNRSFFDGLNNIEQIVVMGFSFNDIDLPYLEEIVKMSGKVLHWLVFYHTSQDNEAIDAFVARMGLYNVRKFYL